MGAIRIDRATDLDRRTIYGLRHRVYALELGQHAARPEAELTDSIDARNDYLTASVDDELVGFVSLTPPGGGVTRSTSTSRAKTFRSQSTAGSGKFGC